MKRIKCICLLSLFLICCLLSGCIREYQLAHPYDFPCKDQEIVSIELMYNMERDGHHQGIEENLMKVLKVLSTEEIEPFMTELYALDTQHVGPPVFWGYGAYFARVTYANGDVEIYGTNNFEYIPNGSKPTGYGSHGFCDADAYQALIQKYRNNDKSDNGDNEGDNKKPSRPIIVG